MRNHVASLCLVSISTLALAAAASSVPSGPDAQPAKKHDAAQTAQPIGDPGERIFRTNCARCHNPPMTLPPRITGTVILHMRVRARLSHADEQLLLKYLAP